MSGFKQLFYRGLYGQSLGWEGLDVLRFAHGHLRDKRTYCQGQAAARAPGSTVSLWVKVSREMD